MSPADATTPRSSLAERYRVLLDISHTLARTLRPQRLYRTIYEETARVLETTGFYISLYDDQTDLATVVFYADEGVEREVEITYRGSDSEVLRIGQGVTVADRVESRSLLVLGDQSSEITRSAISAPLLYEGRVVGAISTQSYRPNTYRDEDLELLQGIADLAAVAIKNARHVTELESRRREAEREEEIGRAITSSLDAREVLRKVMDAVLELLRADGSTVWLLENGWARVGASSGRLRLPEGASWELSEALIQKVVRDREPLFVQDIVRDPLLPEEIRGALKASSGLLVPLVMDNEVAGALSAGKAGKDGFSGEDVDILVRLASQASVALVNARLHENIRALSLTDPLTDLPNRRHLEMHLTREVAAARRGREVCVVLFDLDDFKSLNDTLGHVAGDRILRGFGRILLSETRAMNLAARFGGDEFISVLSDNTRKGAELHAERVLKRLAADPELSPHGVTASYGIGEFDPSAMFEVEDLVQAADRDLYRFKERRGRGTSPH